MNQPQRQLGPRQGQQRHRFRDVARLGRVGPQKLAPRRHGAEQVAHLDAGAARVSDVSHMSELSVVDLDLGPGLGIGGSCAQHEV